MIENKLQYYHNIANYNARKNAGEIPDEAIVFVEEADDVIVRGHSFGLPDGSVTTAKLANSAVTTSKIKDLNVTTEKIADKAVTTEKINELAVTTSKINDVAITTEKLRDSAVTTSKIADLNVTTAKLANSSVTTDKLNNKAVTLDKMADNSVDSSKIVDYSITERDLADNSISHTKLQDNCVTPSKILDGSITTAKIAEMAVTASKLANGAVTEKKIADQAVTIDKIANEAVTAEKIAFKAVTNEKLADGSITNEKIKDGTITNEKIKDGTITNEKIKDGTITIEKIESNFAHDISKDLDLHDIAFSGSYNDLEDKPIGLTATNDNGFASKQFVNERIANLVGDAPEALDTLYEIAHALQDDDNVVNAILNRIANLENGVTGPEIISTLSGLTDVTLSSLKKGQFFVYNGTKWVNRTLKIGDTVIDPDTENSSSEITISLALGDLTNVNISSVSNGQSLVYRNGKWVNEEVGSDGSTTLSGLSDVTLSLLAKNQFLVYDGSKWSNKTIKIGGIDINPGDSSNDEIDLSFALESLTNVNISSASNGQALVYRGGSWVNETISVSNPGSGGATALSQLTDVNLGSLSNGQSLVYEDGKWINKTISIDPSQGAVLATHKIWGQDFNGTNDVTGSLSGVENIDTSGYIVVGGVGPTAYKLKVKGTANIEGALDCSADVQVTGKLNCSTTINGATITMAGATVATQNWVESQGYLKSVEGGITTSLSALTDTTISSPTDGQSLVYRSGKWINETISVSGGSGGDTVDGNYATEQYVDNYVKSHVYKDIQTGDVSSSGMGMTPDHYYVLTVNAASKTSDIQFTNDHNKDYNGHTSHAIVYNSTNSTKIFQLFDTSKFDAHVISNTDQIAVATRRYLEINALWLDGKVYVRMAVL